MRRAAAKPPLTIEQRHQEKLNNWKVRRILRMTQTRDQANQASCNMRVNFWTEVDCIAQNMLDAEMETRRIELELQRKRQDAAEHKRQEELRIMAEQELAEEDIREQKKRQAVEYATRARERFNKALSIEKKRRADERRWAEEITDSMKATRKDESQKSRQRAAQAREAVIPDTTLVSFAHRDSMIPRELLPQPTSVEKPKHLETIFSVSPLSPSRTVPEEVRSVATEDRTAGVTDQKQPSGPTLRPRPLKTRENIPQESQLSDRPKKPSKPVIPALVRDIETCTTPGSTKSESVDWSGSIIDLGKENIEPVHPAFSPWSYSSHSVVPLGGRRIQPVSTESIAISAQTSLDTSDSFRSFDSDTLRSVFQHPAVQLSPPKQPPHPHNLRPRRPARPPATTTTDQSTLPDSKTPTPKKKRPALRQVENLPTQPESDAKPPSRPARQKSAVSRPQNPADLLGDLQEVMRALQILDANVLGRDRHSFSMSASSGPLSTPESGGLYSNESWLSQQTLSCETSSSHMTYESGSLFTSHDESLESGPVDLSFLPGSQDVSGLSNGNLDELSGNDIDLL